MTLASRHWWRVTGPKITGGLLIFAGVLLTLLSQVVFPRYAGFGLAGGLVLAGVGALIIVLAAD